MSLCNGHTFFLNFVEKTGDFDYDTVKEHLLTGLAELRKVVGRHFDYRYNILSNRSGFIIGFAYIYIRDREVCNTLSGGNLFRTVAPVASSWADFMDEEENVTPSLPPKEEWICPTSEPLEVTTNFFPSLGTIRHFYPGTEELQFSKFQIKTAIPLDDKMSDANLIEMLSFFSSGSAPVIISSYPDPRGFGTVKVINFSPEKSDALYAIMLVRRYFLREEGGPAIIFCAAKNGSEQRGNSPRTRSPPVHNNVYKKHENKRDSDGWTSSPVKTRTSKK